MPDKAVYKQSLKPENYLELWKYFTDDAAKIKDRMWTIASLFFAAVTALISFIANKLSGFNKESILKNQGYILLIITSLALLGLCTYFKYIIIQYGRHISSGWNRANYIRTRIEGLSEIWHLGNEELIETGNKMPAAESLPGEAKRLIYFSNLVIAGYLLFLVILLIFFMAG
jgi:hypothetical protein